ncbi:MAG TPA: phasin family protein [Burkholderiales bacterium]|jgi:phasin family protein|nr:phasin family protein [Burkholderiales bacterium]
MTQPQADLFDIYRAGLKTAADLVKASLESAERLQNQQLVAIRSVIDQQSKSATELSRAKTLDELLAVQTRIVGQQFESAVTLWSDLVQAAGENQRVAIGRMQDQLAQARDWMGSASLPLVVRQAEEAKGHRAKA